MLVLAAGALPQRALAPARDGRAVGARSALAFGLSNPDARIAEHNIARYERGGEIDRTYLAELSPDAAPALARLPAPLASGRSDRRERRSRTPDGLAGTNLGRARARAALKRR